MRHKSQRIETLLFSFVYIFTEILTNRISEVNKLPQSACYRCPVIGHESIWSFILSRIVEFSQLIVESNSNVKKNQMNTSIYKRTLNNETFICVFTTLAVYCTSLASPNNSSITGSHTSLTIKSVSLYYVV